jgi:hypothetical protein
MKEAKKLSYKTNKTAVNFLILKDSSPLNVSIEEFIKANYKTPSDFHKTLRPYVIDDFREELLDFLPKFKVVPNTQLNLIKELILNETPLVASLNIRYQTARMKEIWEKVFPNKLVTQWADFFLTEENGVYRTRYIDLLELLEFWG